MVSNYFGHGIQEVYSNITLLQKKNLNNGRPKPRDLKENSV